MQHNQAVPFGDSQQTPGHCSHSVVCQSVHCNIMVWIHCSLDICYISLVLLGHVSFVWFFCFQHKGACWLSWPKEGVSQIKLYHICIMQAPNWVILSLNCGNARVKVNEFVSFTEKLFPHSLLCKILLSQWCISSLVIPVLNTDDLRSIDMFLICYTILFLERRYPLWRPKPLEKGTKLHTKQVFLCNLLA